ncbi:Ubiquitin family protein [Trichomonas vaginalis G3]|uniref:Ubiquitin family protein n=1 Tax=Trichomonas vaginalis (strain ATCC PRA-98 / G3) TaxID=412133 RepID=A2EN73_TRIV3|nr:protein neddylation [Trichomonas vaginalis G3]EAY05910.1 Ubiquitin family protein [Trichomonas vaginalis G3]KAI5520206.1 protein neddylation [Trichomonas vaginalis G3]|eukprot:XP_001318133.1 Ubiquitin family protein [Trichomonas vaginalis G3]
MEPNWKEIGENIGKYVDDEQFLSKTKPQDICKALSYAKLTCCQFSTLFTNLSRFYGKQDMLTMLIRARTDSLKTREELYEVSETISSVLGIHVLNKILAFSLSNRTAPTSPRTQTAPANPDIANQIFVQSRDKRYEFKHVNTNIPVKQLKKMIFDIDGIAIDQQRLLFRGIQIENDKLLKDYDIRDLCVIHLAVYPKN